MSIQPGRHIKHYVINDIIARGGMGVVWRALDIEKDEFVAIKAVSNDLISDSAFKARIKDEARRHLRLRHPNIVPVLDVFEFRDETCIIMELIDGTSLDSLLANKKDNRLDKEEAILIVQDILNALDYAHQAGIVHRDVKPSNVLLRKHNRALLIDFGIALAVGEERRTRTGQIVGTPLYMSPEQITNPTHIDHRSDVYSTGCVLYEMLSGRPPFVQGQDGVGDTDFAIQEAHVKIRPTNLRNHIPDIPAYLDELVMEALEKNPDQRIPGCREFVRLLEQAGKYPDDAQDDRDLEDAQNRHRKIKQIVGLLLALLLGVIGLIIVLNS